MSSLALSFSAQSFAPGDIPIQYEYSILPPPEKVVQGDKSQLVPFVPTGDGSVSFLGKYNLTKNALRLSTDPLLSDVKEYFANAIGNSSLQLKEVSRIKDENGVLISFIQTVNNATIEGTYAIAQVKNGSLQYSRHLLVDPPDINDKTKIQSSEATNIAIQNLEEVSKNAITKKDPPRLTVVYNKNSEPILTWAVSVDTKAPFGKWTNYIDAQNGNLIIRKKRSLDSVRGKVTACVEPSCQNDKTEKSALPYAKWYRKNTADEKGEFYNANDIKKSEVSLNGKYFRINDTDNNTINKISDLTPEPAFNDIFLNDAPLSQTDPYFYANKVRSWVVERAKTVSGLLYIPNFRSWIESQININVNLNSKCNAYYNGELNFFKESENPRCNNTGRVAKIVFHEYGHGIHDHLSPIFNDTVSEGVADYVAATITNDPNMTGLTGCSDVLKGKTYRKCVNQYTYCNGTGCDSGPRDDPHNPAPVMCGALWELRDSLIARYGEDIGTLKADQIFLRFLSRVSGMDSAYSSIIAADEDTDGNPANGTTHSCEINKAFIGTKNNEFAHFPDLVTQRVPCAS